MKGEHSLKLTYTFFTYFIKTYALTYCYNLVLHRWRGHINVRLVLTSLHLAVFEDDSLKDDNHGNCKLITYKYFLAWILLSRPPRVTEGLSLQLFSSIGALVMQMLVCWSVCLLVSVYFLFVITQSIFMLGPPNFAWK